MQTVRGYFHSQHSGILLPWLANEAELLDELAREKKNRIVYEKKLSKENKKKRRAAKKSFFDSADDISETSTRQARLDKTILPPGIISKKQFKKMTEDKFLKLFQEVDDDE